MELPSHFGKYDIIDILGKGSMGLVYKGFDPHICRFVAIKTIRKDRVTSDVENNLERFKHEAQAAGRLSHGGIVSIYELGEEEDTVYIVMEYVEGHDLGEYFTRGRRFNREESVSIVVQLLDALGHAHELGVVHRDIKPANIILKATGHIKVADFGIAHIYSSELTEVGVVMGTPSYMAPEQFRGEPVDGRADLYSVGVLLFQLLTGQRPFKGSYEQILYSVCNVTAPLPSSVGPDKIPAHYDSIVEKALAKNPRDRYASASSFKDALLAVFPLPAVTPVSTIKIPSESLLVNEQPDHAAVSDSSSAKSAMREGSLSPPGWNPDVLKKIERQLAEYVGPLSHILVKKAAMSTTKLDELYAQLADELNNNDDKAAFLASRLTLDSTVSTTSATPGHASVAASFSSAAGDSGRHNISSPDAISSEMLEKAVRDLAPYMGPISKIIVKNTAAHCLNKYNLYSLLAENIEDAGERERFLLAVGQTGGK